MDRFEQPVMPIRHAPDRRGRIAALALLAAVIVVIAAAVAGTQGIGPAPSPLASIALVSPSSSGVASPSALASGSLRPVGTAVLVTPSPSPAPTVPPTYPPDAFVDRPEWRISLDGATAKDQVVALIVDPERRVTGAAPAAMRLFTIGFTGGVLPADSDHAVDVYWRSSVCGRWETVTLGPDGSIAVNTTPSDTVCTPGPTMRGLELRFATKVNATSFSLHVGPERRYPDDLMPFAAAFSDAKHGLVVMSDGGTAAVAETADGGASWRMTYLGDGTPTGVTLAGDTAWTAMACDPSVWDHCSSGVYRRANGVWTRIHAMDPGPMAVQGDNVAVLDQPLNAVAPPTGIDVSSDGGATWRSIPVPCSVGHATGIANPGTLEVVCQASAASDALSDKALWVSQDDALTIWTQAVLPESGTKVGISMAPGGTGVLWGTMTPPFLTDGGGRWIANPIADGHARIARSGDAQPDGAVTLLVYDPGRNATLLLRTTDGGATWTELTSFRDLPCCGG